MSQTGSSPDSGSEVYASDEQPWSIDLMWLASINIIQGENLKICLYIATFEMYTVLVMMKIQVSFLH